MRGYGESPRGDRADVGSETMGLTAVTAPRFFQSLRPVASDLPAPSFVILCRYWSQDSEFLGFIFCCIPLLWPRIGNFARVRTVSRTVIGAIQYHKVLDPWMKARAHDFKKERQLVCFQLGLLHTGGFSMQIGQTLQLFHSKQQ